MLRKLGWGYVTIPGSGSGTTGATGQVAFFTNANVIGPCTNNFFYDSTNKRLAISANGNTPLTSPQAILHIQRVSVFGTPSVLRLDTDSQFGGPNQVNLEFFDQGNGRFAIYKPTDDSLRIFNYQVGLGQDTIRFGAGANNDVFVTNSLYANVLAAGITASPSSKLHIRGSSNSDSFLHVEDSGATVGFRSGIQTGTPNFTFVQSTGAHEMRFYISSTNYWAINTSGDWEGRRTGGQKILGGTAASDTLTLQSTSNATRGDLITDCADVTHVSGSKFRMAGQNRFRHLNNMCSVYQSTAQTSQAVNTWNTTTFTSELFDTDTMHDNVTNTSRITVPIAGKYLIIGGVGVDPANVTGPSESYGRIILNGGTVNNYGLSNNYVPSTGTTVYVTCVALMSLAANDYVELQVFVTGSGGTYATIPSGTVPYATHFEAVYLGE